MTWLYGVILAGIVAWGAWRKNWLSASGAYAAVVVGSGIFAGGLVTTASILFFFFSTAALGIWARPRTPSTSISDEQAKGRTGTQVLAVGIVPAVAAAMFAWSQNPVWLWVTTAALSFATADSWSTEIGQTSPGETRMLLWGPRVMTGLSGGMTGRGTWAGIAGAGALALVASPGLIAHHSWAVVLLAVTGFLGSLLDSLLGATVQARWRCSQCGNPTESPLHCNAESQSLRRGLSNTGVNMVCSIAAGMGGGWLYS